MSTLGGATTSSAGVWKVVGVLVLPSGSLANAVNVSFAFAVPAGRFTAKEPVPSAVPVAITFPSASRISMVAFGSAVPVT